jgi:hypothetical protein
MQVARVEAFAVVGGEDDAGEEGEGANEPETLLLVPPRVSYCLLWSPVHLIY